MRPRVFVPQIPMMTEPGTARLVPKFNTLEAIKPYGDLVVLVEQHLAFAGRKDCIDKIVYELRDYRDDDYFLPMGSQFFMMIAAIVISNKVNEIQMLEWSSRERQYTKSITNVGQLILSDPHDRRES